MFKRLNHTLILFLFCQICEAQPVIQANDVAYVIGESHAIHDCEWQDAGSPGVDQLWDFSGVTETGTSTVHVVDPAATPAAADFPNSEVATIKTGTGTHQYFDLTGSTLEHLGFKGSVLLPYSNPKLLYPFPMAYGDTASDSFGGTYHSANITWTRTGSTAVEVDGYGTLITPAGTYTDVLRVKMEEMFIDVGGTATNLQSTIYHWFKAGIHFPLVTNSSHLVNGSPHQSMEYADIMTGINQHETLTTTAYPNPAVNEVFIPELVNGARQYELMDVNGKIVGSGVTLTGWVDVRNLVDGTYIVQILNNKKVYGTTRIQVIRP